MSVRQGWRIPDRAKLTVLRPWRYIDVWRDRKGRPRTWLGHLRALAKAEGVTLSEIRRRVERKTP